MTADYYSIDDLDVSDLSVIFRWPGGHEMEGFARFTGAGRLVVVVRRDSGLRDIEFKGRRLPQHWRPVDPAGWPVALPIARDLNLKPPTELAGPREPRDNTGPPMTQEEWPHPGLKLTRAAEIPKSVKDVEARILRCIRTTKVLDHDPPNRDYLWPPLCRVEIYRIEQEMIANRGKVHQARRFSDNDYGQYYFDRSDLRPRPARWQPLPRDVSDYEFRPNPISWIHPHDKAMFAMRADLPEWSWEQMSERFRQPIEVVITAYKYALERAWQAAKRQLTRS